MATRLRVQVKRIHDPPSDEDGFRVLVDRLWPRGISKERAALDAWAKELAPSTDLRRWFKDEAPTFEAFAARYRSELAERGDAAEALRARIDGDVVTLLYAAANRTSNHAEVLASHLRDVW